MKIGLRFRLAAGATAVVLTLGGSVVAAAAAGASTASTGQAALSVSVTVRVPGPQSAGMSSAAAAACKPALNEYNRTELCYQESVGVNVVRNHKKIGKATFTVTHAIELNTRSRDFTEQVSISDVKLSGNAGGIHVALGVKCDSPCTATKNTFPVGDTLRSGLHGDLAYHDAVGAGHVHADRSTYEWLFTKKGATPGATSGRTALAYRCDDAIKHFAAGCVFPEYFPIMTSMQRLPEIAANIRRIQNHGRDHYGRRGSGHPLHHITDSREQDRKRSQVCSRSKTGPPPAGKSCDEYPFASTAEGGTALPASEHGWAWVKVSEQNSQSGLITGFYNANRVLNDDAFWVAV